MKMVTSFNITDMIKFGQWCLSTVPLNIDKSEVERWAESKDGVLMFANPENGVVIKIKGRDAVEAIKDFEDCKNRGVNFHWSGITIPTNNESWIYSYSKE